MRTIYVAGHTGLVGSALMRRFQTNPAIRLVTAPRAELDLRDGAAVELFLNQTKPDAVILAAGRVGGIQANSRRPAEFLYDNLSMETNLIHASWKAGVKKLLNFGSSCMYPRECSQPMKPEHLMTGRMEPTSEPYAVAKLAGMALCQAYSRQYGARFISAIPCTVYGQGDNFDLEEGHVLSALLRRFHEAKEQGLKEVTLWGSGAARREFVYCDDLVEACEILLDRYDGVEPVNLGSGQVCSIRELAEACARVAGFTGRVFWDTSRPDGAPEKTLESSVIRALGWKPRTDPLEGIRKTYAWFVQRKNAGMARAAA